MRNTSTNTNMRADTSASSILNIVKLEHIQFIIDIVIFIMLLVLFIFIIYVVAVFLPAVASANTAYFNVTSLLMCDQTSVSKAITLLNNLKTYPLFGAITTSFVTSAVSDINNTCSYVQNHTYSP